MPANYMATITNPRRGIWIARCDEYESGTEGVDAFRTLAQAKRWCAEWCGASLTWREYTPGQWISEMVREA